MGSLHDLRPTSPGYATEPVADAFDWADASAELVSGAWYLVVFRSVRRLDADETRLNELDDAAHLEASRAPGFVHYFKGPKADDGTCLSFCIWDSRAQARSGAGMPAHREAVMVLDEMYAAYTLEFLRMGRAHAGAPLIFEAYDRLPAAIAPPVGDMLAFPPAAPGFDPALAPS